MRTSIAIVALVSLVSLSGCFDLAAIQKQQEEDAAAMRRVSESEPRCSHPRQCEAMWVAARDWITESCGYKIQTVTDNLLETYNSTGVDLACRVTKTPLPEAGYKFNASADCGNMFGCMPKPVVALQQFNDKLINVGSAFKD